jgi:hypothetical protein
MPNVDFINQKDFRDTIIIKGEKANPDLTTQMFYFIRFIVIRKATKYGLEDPHCVQYFHEFQTSLLVYRHIGFSKQDLMEIIDSQLSYTNESHGDDSLLSNHI